MTGFGRPVDQTSSGLATFRNTGTEACFNNRKLTRFTITVEFTN